MNKPIKFRDLAPAPGAKKKKTRIGRGEASKGKTTGRSTKSTKAREQVLAAFKGGQAPLRVRLPRLKGFKNPAKVTFQMVNVSGLEHLLSSGGDITVTDLVVKGVVHANQPVEVLGDGDINVSVNVTTTKFLDSAKLEIEAAGGSVTEA